MADRPSNQLIGCIFLWGGRYCRFCNLGKNSSRNYSPRFFYGPIAKQAAPAKSFHLVRIVKQEQFNLQPILTQ